jgi:hypothetical protein
MQNPAACVHFNKTLSNLAAFGLEVENGNG